MAAALKLSEPPFLSWELSSGTTVDGQLALPGWRSIDLEGGAIEAAFVNRRLRRAFALHKRSFSPDTVEHFLSDLLLPRLVASDGMLVLHGSLVSTSIGLVAFVGASGKGKSTLSGSFAVCGMPLLTDDAFCLRTTGNEWIATRFCPSLRLLPDSLDRLFPGIEGTAPVADYSSKRRVAVAADQTEGPIVAIFELGDDVEEIKCTRLSQAQACMTLISNAFALDTDNPQETSRRFCDASEASRSLPVYSLEYPRNFDHLPQVHKAILKEIGADPSFLHYPRSPALEVAPCSAAPSEDRLF